MSFWNFLLCLTRLLLFPGRSCDDDLLGLGEVPALWLYPEPIFSSEDIMQQLPEEGRLFNIVDRSWKDIMKYAVRDAHVMAATSMPGLLERLRDSNGFLDKINKGLDAYLEMKRLFLPRFFVLSNDETLEILSETKDPTRVQPHLKKCFEGVGRLDFARRLDVLAMFSSEGEKVQTSQVISTSEARGAVEKWLLQVHDVMLMSVRDVITAAREWSDGVTANTFREFAMADTLDKKWVVFDGPIDAVWIENVNTVLDDNKKLRLMSGEVIQMSAPMSLIFETMDLSQASPATVSRCGMIYLEPITFGWRSLMTSWINALPIRLTEEHSQVIVDVFEWLVDPCVTCVHKNCKEYVPTGVSNVIVALMRLVEMLMADACADPEVDENRHLKTWLLQKSRGTWKPWLDFIKGTFAPAPGKQLQEILVPTMDTARYSYLMDLFIRFKIPALFVGPTGTGKSVYVQTKLMNDLPKESFVLAFINFSAQTSADQTQMLIMTKLDKRKKGTYGPPPGKMAVIFVGDINMPALEVYGAQPPIERLRQYFDHKHWYDLKDTTRLHLEDIQFLAAMGPPGGGRNPVTPRFLRHFNIVSINPFHDETMTKIFCILMTTYLRAASSNTQMLEGAREKRLKEAKMYEILREVILYAFFLWIVIVISYDFGDPRAQQVKANLQVMFVSRLKPSDPVLTMKEKERETFSTRPDRDVEYIILIQHYDDNAKVVRRTTGQQMQRFGLGHKTRCGKIFEWNNLRQPLYVSFFLYLRPS